MRRLQNEFGPQLSISWRAFLLRPDPESRTLEDFVIYTRSWQRPASDLDGGRFREWSTGEGPPSHSIPPHLVAKAAAKISGEKFDLIHERIMDAYFWENRDITSDDTLYQIWKEVGLPEETYTSAKSTKLRDEVYAEHSEAISVNANGVPAVRSSDQDFCVVGAQPVDLYRRWIERILASKSV